MLKLKSDVSKILIVMLVVVALIIPVASYATDSGITVISPGTPSPAPASPVINTTPTPSPVATPSPINQSKLPQTGIGDNTGLIVATIILGVSVVFAYIKIKQYKDIK